MKFNLRHLIEQIICDYCEGDLYKEEIDWPFDETLVVHLKVGNDYDSYDVEVREIDDGQVFLRDFKRRWASLELPDDSPVFDLFQESGLNNLISELQERLGEDPVYLYVDGTTTRDRNARRS